MFSRLLVVALLVFPLSGIAHDGVQSKIDTAVDTIAKGRKQGCDTIERELERAFAYPAEQEWHRVTYRSLEERVPKGDASYVYGLMKIYGARLTYIRQMKESWVKWWSSAMPASGPGFYLSTREPGENYYAFGNESDFVAACKAILSVVPPTDSELGEFLAVLSEYQDGYFSWIKEDLKLIREMRGLVDDACRNKPTYWSVLGGRYFVFQFRSYAEFEHVKIRLGGIAGYEDALRGIIKELDDDLTSSNSKVAVCRSHDQAIAQLRKLSKQGLQARQYVESALQKRNLPSYSELREAFEKVRVGESANAAIQKTF